MILQDMIKHGEEMLKTGKIKKNKKKPLFQIQYNLEHHDTKVSAE